MISDRFIVTASGRRFYPFAPERGGVQIDDVIHALARISRFTGHTRGEHIYSVAQHSVLVASIVADELGHPEHALAALLHDAPEAFYGDVASPLKAGLSEYRVTYALGEDAVMRSLGVSLPLPPVVHQGDMIALATEARDLMCADWEDWGLPYPPCEDRMVVAKPVKDSELSFRNLYIALTSPSRS